MNTIVVRCEDYRAAKRMWQLLEFLDANEYEAEFHVNGSRVSRAGDMNTLPTEVDSQFIRDWENAIKQRGNHENPS